MFDPAPELKNRNFENIMAEGSMKSVVLAILCVLSFELYAGDPFVDNDSHNYEGGDGVDLALRFNSAGYVYSFEKRGLSGYRLVVRRGGNEVLIRAVICQGKPMW